MGPIDAEAEAARLRKDLKNSISLEKAKEMLESKEVEYMDELKQARENMKTTALLQEEHQQLVDQNKSLVTANRELQEQVNGFYMKMTESEKRQEVAVAELLDSIRLAEEREKVLMEQLKVANETLLSKFPSPLSCRPSCKAPCSNLCPDACPELEEQARQATRRLQAVSAPAAVAVESFCSAESMANTVVTLEDRLQQIANLVPNMKAAV